MEGVHYKVCRHFRINSKVIENKPKKSKLLHSFRKHKNKLNTNSVVLLKIVGKKKAFQLC